jgi:hypothetical protein
MTTPTTDDDNARRWTDASRGVYEVWYMTWNDPKTGDGFWLRYITEAPQEGDARGEIWFTRFSARDPAKTFGIRRHVPLTQVASTKAPFSLSIAGSRLAHDGASGHLAGNGHDVHWNLGWDAADQTIRLLPDVMYARGGLGETTVHSPNPRVPVTGTVIVDGETYTFDRAPFGQTHVWGKKHAYMWTWGRCADFDGASDVLIEVFGCRLQRRGIVTPRLSLVVLDLDGEQHRLNQYRHVVRNRCSWETGRYQFSAWSPTVKIEGELTCSPSQMINAEYIDPDGTQVWCANTEIGDARVTVYRRGGLGWREHRVLSSRGRAHFEHGGRTRDPSVTHLHELVR